ncbi:hypothetical protein BGZ70_005604 [Mortierella alpina]|uniref:Uncharacterized protein n=1 Tax=Mortierella alpina TaxID=64518 RepID=A0A9P6JFK7_MORAP|nr:hypothetical protein BGZ70_005604 [Mortierella alpina]
MARQIILLLTIVLCLAGLSYVDACEEACRSDPVTYLVKRYAAILDYQTDLIEDPDTAALAKAQIPEIVKKIDGRNNVIDKTIFNNFKGPCENMPGQRHPEEFCGSAKSIACFAAWEHPVSVFQMVHDAVVHTVQRHYAPLGKEHREINDVVVDGLEKFCPENCQDWVEPFAHFMLVWEQREHPRKYSITPNCLPLQLGGF